MPIDLSYYTAAFLVGLLGGVHCIGMCGGIVGALAFGVKEEVRGRPLALLPYLVSYNGGRVASYTVAGAIMGSIGVAAANLVTLQQTEQILHLAAGLFMVALGLYLGGWWHAISHVERVGVFFWRRLQPLGHRLLPVKSPLQALTFGLVWGWLPCGMVYTALISALAAGGPLEGGLLMLSFGLGTVPNLVAMGLFAGKMAFARQPSVRRIAGLIVLAFGVAAIVRGVVGLQAV